ncbi:hypothetical protein FIBSPDRAFT_885265 [Athelia psychrophila]|uniref:Uncharacterized protein n=1 Tax=Athelia psychrophila TaxID=1759441 RepID=A0A166S9N0_9AGAM|nr:hypothetical protein FIBSPDRAFT_885265 [Fibularhizoctonia sp. CBS 109695]
MFILVQTLFHGPQGKWTSISRNSDPLNSRGSNILQSQQQEEPTAASAVEEGEGGRAAEVRDAVRVYQVAEREGGRVPQELCESGEARQHADVRGGQVVLRRVSEGRAVAVAVDRDGGEEVPGLFRPRPAAVGAVALGGVVFAGVEVEVEVEVEAALEGGAGSGREEGEAGAERKHALSVQADLGRVAARLPRAPAVAEVAGVGEGGGGGAGAYVEAHGGRLVAVAHRRHHETLGPAPAPGVRPRREEDPPLAGHLPAQPPVPPPAPPLPLRLPPPRLAPAGPAPTPPPRLHRVALASGATRHPARAGVECVEWSWPTARPSPPSALLPPRQDGAGPSALPQAMRAFLPPPPPLRTRQAVRAHPARFYA